MKYKELTKTSTRLVSNNYLNDWLVGKGMTKEAYDALMNPCAEHNPELMYGMKEFYDHIQDHISSKNKIMVSTDYDADGVCGGAIMYLILAELGADVDIAVPNRMRDGYGLNSRMVQQYHDAGVKCIVTVDNGIACHEAVNLARSLGIQVLISDHHTPSEVLPNADVILHPQLGTYPWPNISGATVAYKFAKYCLDKGVIEDGPLMSYLLQLAGITIISDVMPVGGYSFEENSKNENRGILISALKSMREEPDGHIDMFLEILGINPKEVDETTIGFNIGPTINAVGRLDDAMEAIKFFISNDEEDAYLQLNKLVYFNDKRKELKVENTNMAREILDTSKPALLVACEKLHEGLVGIIAGQLAEEYQKPTFVLTETEINGEKAWKGSGRSNSIHLFDMLSDPTIKSHVYAFGGHAGAAGLSILDSKLEEFKDAYYAYVDAHMSDCIPEREFVEIPKYKDVQNFGKVLETLKPFGLGFEKPLVKSKMNVTSIDGFYSKGHLKFNSFDFMTKSQDELWLYFELPNFLDKNLLGGYNLSKSNYQDKIKDGMSPDEAKACMWNKWTAKKGCSLKMDLFLEVDYGWFKGEKGTQLRVVEYNAN